MKRYSLFITILCLLVVIFAFAMLTSCKSGDETGCPFADISWTREAEHDTETIRFGSDGSYTYSCGCGNPVDDSDLAEGYTYDAHSGIISISYIDTTEDTVETIEVKSLSEDNIVLSFNGDIRSFDKTEN